MQEEIFGRILPLISVKQMDDAIRFINARPHPLVLYAFTRNKALQESLRHTTRSGALVFNETLLHHAFSSLPFGGVGESGMGAYPAVTVLNVLAICAASFINPSAPPAGG